MWWELTGKSREVIVIKSEAFYDGTLSSCILAGSSFGVGWRTGSERVRTGVASCWGSGRVSSDILAELCADHAEEDHCSRLLSFKFGDTRRFPDAHFWGKKTALGEKPSALLGAIDIEDPEAKNHWNENSLDRNFVFPSD